MAAKGNDGRPGHAATALVLHHSVAVADLVTRTLNHGLFEVRRVGTVREAEALLGVWPADIAIVAMEHEHCAQLLRLLGASNTMTRAETPVLALSGRTDLPTRLRAFDLGVDDIVGTPFVPEELIARAKVIAGRAAGTRQQFVPTIRIDAIEIDIANSEIRQAGHAVALTRTEQGVLRVLATNAGDVVSRDALLDAVWGIDHVPESNVVDRHVRDVRVKLHDDHRRPLFIETVAGRGYRFLPVFANGSWERP